MAAMTATHDLGLSSRVLTQFKSCISGSLAQASHTCLDRLTDGLDINKTEEKQLCDIALKEILYSKLKEADVQGCLAVIQVALVAAKRSSCSLGTPFILLEDIFDCLTVPDCEASFSFVEDNLDEWRSKLLLTTGKNYLLRMCNNLLRRLSTLRNTVFCGRIQLFLAQLFPLDEKSALNIMGAFNLDNVTVFATNEAINEDNFAEQTTIRADESSQANGEAAKAVDYALYKKFWSIQDYFRSPNQLYERKNWLNLVSNASAVLAVFSQHKLDNIQLKSNPSQHPDAEADSVYFPKNLTSERLFDLQMGDTHFRRHFLIQLLILFQYLADRDVKFKTPQQTPTDEMTLWINKTTEKVYSLLEESPPNGPTLVQTIRHVLSREGMWNSWKNDGCRSFLTRPCEPAGSESPAPNTKNRARRITIADSFGQPPAKQINLGSRELTRLWNIEPDNMKACRAENRKCFPELESFFEEAAEQLPPEAGVEDEYKLILQPNYQWRSLRLLARKSSHFFQPSATVKTVPEFLKTIIQKTLPQHSKPASTPSVPSTPTHEPNEAAEAAAAAAAVAAPAPHEDLKAGAGADESAEQAEQQPSEQEIEKIAASLDDEGKKYDLAVQLDFKDDEIDTLKKESGWERKMLLQWLSREGADATIANLVQSLIDVGLHNTVHAVYPKLLPAEYNEEPDTAAAAGEHDSGEKMET